MSPDVSGHVDGLPRRDDAAVIFGSLTPSEAPPKAGSGFPR